jgi:hypothetical protein
MIIDLLSPGKEGKLKACCIFGKKKIQRKENIT